MSKKTVRSKDAAQAVKSESATLERAKRAARKVIQNNIARIEAQERGATIGAPETEPAPQREPAPGTHGPEGSPKAGNAKHAKSGKKAPPAKKAAKRAKPAKATTPAKPKKLSCLDAAAQIIGKDPIGCADLIAEIGQRGLWKSPSGKTPEASLYAAIIRETSAKKSAARFKKVDRGLFVKNG